MRLFLDANVLFTAAHNPNGKAALVMELGQTGLLQLATSAYAREEARRNLERKYPGCFAAFERQLAKIRIVGDSDRGTCPQGLAEKDRPIYRAARACRADVLLTGDIRGFGFLMNAPNETEGLLIQTVADFLDGF
jgi:predicted nucleic acid-binding protein